MKTLIVIPARWGSTRFPGKPLHAIAGRPMLERVVLAARAGAAGRDVAVAVATDDARIMDFCRQIGAPAVMTDPELASGTDRVRAAAALLAPDAGFVLNLQGDAPFTPPHQIAALLDAAASPPPGGFDVATPVVRLSWEALDRLRETKKVTPFSGTTCIRAPDGTALWFSKIILPAIRKEADLRAAGPLSPVFQHVGLYGYTPAALERIADLPVSTYEALEGLEQLRFIENGLKVHAVETRAADIAVSGIDTPEDAARAEALIARAGDPQAGGA